MKRRDVGSIHITQTECSEWTEIIMYDETATTEITVGGGLDEMVVIGAPLAYNSSLLLDNILVQVAHMVFRLHSACNLLSILLHRTGL